MAAVDASGRGAQKDDGRIRVLREIGARAIPTHLAVSSVPGGRSALVVVERLARDASMTDDAAAAAVRVARAVALLEHPNVVRVREVTVRPDELRVVHEMIDGERLSELWRVDAGPDAIPPLVIALRVLVDVLTGLSALHNMRDVQRQQPMRLAHGELTSDNVLVGLDGVARLMLAGRIRRAGDLPAQHFGTLAPEVLAGESYDARADVYSVGALLWEALSGTPAFAGLTSEEIVESVRSAETERAFVPTDAPWAAPLADVAARAMQAMPDKRFPTAAAMAADMRKAIGAKLTTPLRVASFMKTAAGEKIAARRAAGAPAAPSPLAPVQPAPHAVSPPAPPAAPRPLVKPLSPATLSPATLSPAKAAPPALAPAARASNAPVPPRAPPMLLKSKTPTLRPTALPDGSPMPGASPPAAHAAAVVDHEPAPMSAASILDIDMNDVESVPPSMPPVALPPVQPPQHDEVPSFALPQPSFVSEVTPGSVAPTPPPPHTFALAAPMSASPLGVDEAPVSAPPPSSEARPTIPRAPAAAPAISPPPLPNVASPRPPPLSPVVPPPREASPPETHARAAAQAERTDTPPIRAQLPTVPSFAVRGARRRVIVWTVVGACVSLIGIAAWRLATRVDESAVERKPTPTSSATTTSASTSTTPTASAAASAPRAVASVTATAPTPSAVVIAPPSATAPPPPPATTAAPPPPTAAPPPTTPPPPPTVRPPPPPTTPPRPPTTPPPPPTGKPKFDPTRI